ncbi:MAG: glycosyltransferase family 9 protein [Elusimicrobia bacterium]|nr:glycosyltransferase family 9 protein [Elusimicrobiota bacterium]
MKDIKKILAVSTTGIGNLILYTPVLRTLKEWYPQAQITLLCGSRAASMIVSGSDAVGDIWVIDKKRRSEYFRVLSGARKERFDMVITSYLDRSAKVALFTWLSGAGIRIGYESGILSFLYTHRACPGDREHEVRQNLRLLEKLPHKGSVTEKTEIFIDRKAADFADGFIKDRGSVIGFHPGSGTDIGRTAVKRWPAERFSELGDELVKRYGADVVLFGGPGEEELGAAVASKMVYKPVDMTGKLSVKETAALIGKCSLFVTNDSGLMHMAANFGVPVAALFGPTMHWKNHPWGTRYKILRKDLKCSPCYDFGRISCARPECMEGIGVRDVIDACSELMKR